MVNEFPGNERLIVVPENFTFSVFGETLVGCSNVFSSSGLADVRTIEFPFPVSFSAPDKLISVFTVPGAALTTLRIISPGTFVPCRTYRNTIGFGIWS